MITHTGLGDQTLRFQADDASGLGREVQAFSRQLLPADSGWLANFGFHHESLKHDDPARYITDSDFGFGYQRQQRGQWGSITTIEFAGQTLTVTSGLYIEAKTTIERYLGSLAFETLYRNPNKDWTQFEFGGDSRCVYPSTVPGEATTTEQSFTGDWQVTLHNHSALQGVEINQVRGRGYSGGQNAVFFPFVWPSTMSDEERTVIVKAAQVGYQAQGVVVNFSSVQFEGTYEDTEGNELPCLPQSIVTNEICCESTNAAVRPITWADYYGPLDPNRPRPPVGGPQLVPADDTWLWTRWGCNDFCLSMDLAPSIGDGTQPFNCPDGFS